MAKRAVMDQLPVEMMPEGELNYFLFMEVLDLSPATLGRTVDFLVLMTDSTLFRATRTPVKFVCSSLWSRSGRQFLVSGPIRRWSDLHIYQRVTIKK